MPIGFAFPTQPPLGSTMSKGPMARPGGPSIEARCRLVGHSTVRAAVHLSQRA